ncbi:MAG: hypothetical protein HQ582_11025 [Planctomycetes bacterium]|nr:hypothetical protein [Planctomycetota bacterium]
MKNVPENELFSAYVDGELTADEQAQVEQLLAASPAARQLVDELRALSSSLQALPTHKIGEDITARVLRRAEREMLSERQGADPPRPVVAEPEAYPWKGALRRMMRPRNLVWPGAAVAVALVLMFADLNSFRESPSGEVATRAPATADESAEPPAMEAAEEAEAEMVADQAPAEKEGHYFGRVPSDRLDRALGKADASKPAPAMAPETPAPAAEAPAPTAPPSPVIAESSPASRPAKAPMAGRDAQAGYGYGAGGGGVGLAAGRKAADKRDNLADMEVRGRAEPGSRLSVADEIAKPGAGAASQPMAPAAVEEPRPDVPPPDPSLLVLSYRVTAEAARRGVFDKLVEKQAIVQIAPADAEEGKRRWAGGMAVQAAPMPSQVVGKAGVAPGVIQVDMEATRDQISALLGDLNNRADQFSFLAYDDVALGLPALEDATQQGPGQQALGTPFGTTPARRARQLGAEVYDGRQNKGEGVDLDTLLLRRGFQEGVGQVPRRAEVPEADSAEVAKSKLEKKQTSPATPKDGERSAAPARAAKQPVGMATYRVRFMLRVVDVDTFDVAASMASESPAAENAAGDAFQMAEPAAEPAESPAAAGRTAAGSP